MIGVGIALEIMDKNCKQFSKSSKFSFNNVIIK